MLAEKVMVYWLEERQWSIVSEAAVKGETLPGTCTFTKFQGKWYPSLVIAKDHQAALEQSEKAFRRFLNSCLMEEAPEDIEKCIIEYLHENAGNPSPTKQSIRGKQNPPLKKTNEKKKLKDKDLQQTASSCTVVGILNKMRNFLDERMLQTDKQTPKKKTPQKTHSQLSVRQSVVKQDQNDKNFLDERMPQTDKQTPKKKTPQKTHSQLYVRQSVVEQDQNDKYVTISQLENILDGFVRNSHCK